MVIVKSNIVRQFIINYITTFSNWSLYPTPSGDGAALRCPQVSPFAGHLVGPSCLILVTWALAFAPFAQVVAWAMLQAEKNVRSISC